MDEEALDGRPSTATGMPHDVPFVPTTIGKPRAVEVHFEAREGVEDTGNEAQDGSLAALYMATALVVSGSGSGSGGARGGKRGVGEGGGGKESDEEGRGRESLFDICHAFDGVPSDAAIDA
jgi:hypothetical protein